MNNLLTALAIIGVILGLAGLFTSVLVIFVNAVFADSDEEL